MATVHTRVFLAAGAWLLGVVAATGGSLAAVSLIGQSIAAPPTQQLTVSAVSHALASGRQEPDPSAAARPSTAPSVRRAGATPEASVSGTSATGTLLSSSGGSVLAGCAGSDAYLISWSPQQGYAADDVVRGPAARARVVFLAGSGGVSLTVTCTDSVPTDVVSPVQGDDDGGGQPGDS
jgi:hypothetical protein